MTRKHAPVGFRRLTRVAVGAALVASLVACGSDDEPDSSSPTASDTSTPVGEESNEPTGAEKVDPQEFVDTLSAGLDASTTAQLTMSVDSADMAMSATGAVDYTGETPSTAMKMTAPELGEGTIDVRLIDEVLYMSMPMNNPSGKFFKIDLNDPDDPMAGSLGGLSSFDPKSTLETFGKGVTSVKVAGNETIDGDETTHYLVTADSKYLTKSLGGSTVDLPKEFSYDIWLDGDGRMRKLITEVGKQGSVEMEMTNWGEPVDIEVPPASQIQQMPRN